MTPAVGDRLTLRPRSIGSGGEGVAIHEGFVVFVEGALPDEEVLAEVKVVKRTFAKAELVEIVKPSPLRIAPPCPYFGECGGCQLQHISYQGQLQIKQQRVIDALKHIGHLDVEVADCIPSDPEFHYRNKIQLPVAYSNDGVLLGLYQRGTHDIIPIQECMIHCELGEKIFQQVKSLQPPNKGKLRTILIKTAVNTGESLVVLITTGLDQKWLKEFAKRIEVTGVVENINRRKDNVVLGDSFNLVSGSMYIEEQICGKIFRVSPHSFFQVNTGQAEKIYQHVVELADLNSSKTLVDAFCGVGTFALIASDHVKEVCGIDCVKLAVDDAGYNAEKNRVTNARFIHGRAEFELKKLPQFDVAFLNPPRKGCEPVLLASLASPCVVYMSCNPATLARDLHLLSDRYRIEAVIPYDMFPQTTHVETVVKLVRK